MLASYRGFIVLMWKDPGSQKLLGEPGRLIFSNGF